MSLTMKLLQCFPITWSIKFRLPGSPHQTLPHLSLADFLSLTPFLSPTLTLLFGHLEILAASWTCLAALCHWCSHILPSTNILLPPFLSASVHSSLTTFHSLPWPSPRLSWVLWEHTFLPGNPCPGSSHSSIIIAVPTWTLQQTHATWAW